MTAIMLPGHAFPIGSEDFPEVAKLARQYMFVSHHLAHPLLSTQPIPRAIPAPKEPNTVQSLQVDDEIPFEIPGSREVLKATVTDICTSRVKGMTFHVTYANNPGVEVELGVGRPGDGGNHIGTSPWLTSLSRPYFFHVVHLWLLKFIFRCPSTAVYVPGTPRVPGLVVFLFPLSCKKRALLCGDDLMLDLLSQALADMPCAL